MEEVHISSGGEVLGRMIHEELLNKQTIKDSRNPLGQKLEQYQGKQPYILTWFLFFPKCQLMITVRDRTLARRTFVLNQYGRSYVLATWLFSFFFLMIILKISPTFQGLCSCSACLAPFQYQLRCSLESSPFYCCPNGRNTCFIATKLLLL